MLPKRNKGNKRFLRLKISLKAMNFTLADSLSGIQAYLATFYSLPKVNFCLEMLIWNLFEGFIQEAFCFYNNDMILCYILV